MIHLKLGDPGRSKKEYIESVIETSKQIFNDTFAGDFFHDDDLKVAFCNTENRAVVYESFCGQFFPLYLAERYSRTNFFAAQAMTNIVDGVYGILVCLDTPHEGDEWYQIILHEMSHIFCIVHEIGGENFLAKYCADDEDSLKNGVIRTGYSIWSEFIADYITSQVHPHLGPLSFPEVREDIRSLDKEVSGNDPDGKQAVSQILVSIFRNAKIRQAEDATSALQLLEKNNVFATKAQGRLYHELISYVFNQLLREDYWRIDFDLIESLGIAYWRLIGRKGSP